MKNLMTLIIASLIHTAFWSGVSNHAFADNTQGHDASKSTALAESLKAHGGADTWRSFARMDYSTRDFPLGANAPFDFSQTTDLRSRRHLTRGEGFTSGKNEQGAWALPNTEALGLPPSFFESGNFYFVAMPFVFADPGVIARDLGTETFQQREYNLVAISYPAGIGDTPEDDYILYIDAQTHRLYMIDFVPTSAEVNGDTPIEDLPRKALVFDQWQNADGLLVPSKLTFYGWADGQLQGDGNTYFIHGVTFSKDSPQASLFLTPNQPVIEPSIHAE